MGAVFFVGLLIFTIALSAIFFGVTALLLVLFIIAKGRNKKSKGLLIATIILAVISVVSTILPIGTVVTVTQMYQDAFPQVGPIIDQIVYQQDEFSVDGERYRSLSYKSNISVGEGSFCEPVFTYRQYLLFVPLNSGYYYKLNDNTLNFTLYTSSMGDTIFCSEKDYAKAKEYYETCKWSWRLAGTYFLSSEDSTIINGILQLQDSQDYCYIDPADMGSDIYLESVSYDTYAIRDIFALNKSGNAFYIVLGPIYHETEHYITSYRTIKLTDKMSAILDAYLPKSISG